jgi:hypothetical protein
VWMAPIESFDLTKTAIASQGLKTVWMAPIERCFVVLGSADDKWSGIMLVGRGGRNSYRATTLCTKTQ